MDMDPNQQKAAMQVGGMTANTAGSAVGGRVGGALSGAASGAMAGAPGGLPGMLIGGVLGAGMGAAAGGKQHPAPMFQPPQLPQTMAQTAQTAQLPATAAIAPTGLDAFVIGPPQMPQIGGEGWNLTMPTEEELDRLRRLYEAMNTQIKVG